MADSYLSIAAIASDEFMTERMNAAATQQAHLGNVALGLPPLAWVSENRYLWASSPGWGAAWDSALANSNPEPGKDPAVISDGMILATVQALGNEGASEVNQEANEAPDAAREAATKVQVAQENAAAGDG